MASAEAPQLISLEGLGEAGSSALDRALGLLFAGLLVFCAARCALQPRQCAARPADKAS